MSRKLKNYIGGEWVESSSANFTPVINPATCEVMAECPDSNRADVDNAVRSAREAFGEWRSTPIMNRAQYMHHLKVLMEDRFDSLAEMVV